jgi:hypothetical protein
VPRLVSAGDNNHLRPEKFSAVLPQQIVKKRPSDRLPFLRAHCLRLVMVHGTNIVDAIERQIEELRRTYRAECSLRTGTDRCSLMTPSRESWKLLGERFEEVVVSVPSHSVESGAITSGAITAGAITPAAITTGATTPRAITSRRLRPSPYKPRSGSFSSIYRLVLVFLNRLNLSTLQED